MASLVRTFSFVAYFLIFLKGSMILLPFGFFLLTGVFTGEPWMRILIGLADLALITLLIMSFREPTKWAVHIETICFIALLLPLLKIFTSFSFEWFNYFLFLFPVGCFIVLFPLSIYLGHRSKTANQQKSIGN
jgi:hypothetical protein